MCLSGGWAWRLGLESGLRGSPVLAWALLTVGAFVLVNSGGGSVCCRGKCQGEKNSPQMGVAVAVALLACILAWARLPVCCAWAQRVALTHSARTWVGRAGDPQEEPRRACGRAALSWGLADLSGQPCSPRGSCWGPDPSSTSSSSCACPSGPAGSWASSRRPSACLSPAPAPPPLCLCGRVSVGGPCLPFWGLVVGLLCGTEWGWVWVPRALASGEGPLGEPRGDRQWLHRRWCGVGGKAPNACPEPVEAASGLSFSWLARALSTVGVFLR